jgi:predicted XRE-type DNA-binding protein
MAINKTAVKKAGNELDDLITQAQAAKLRGVSRAAISDLIKRGRLRSKVMFDRALVYRNEVVNFEPKKPGPK